MIARLLLVPGIENSGPDHWQTAWERERDDCRRVEMGCWDDPVPDAWISGLDQAVHATDGEVVLVAHSLGCHAVAWWARRHGAARPPGISGALLVAPPDVDRPDVDPRLARFGPTPDTVLPFPSFVVASRDDPYATLQRSHEIARSWGALFLDAGALGHINAGSGLGDWPLGQDLAELLARGAPDRSALVQRARRVMAEIHGVQGHARGSIMTAI